MKIILQQYSDAVTVRLHKGDRILDIQNVFGADVSRMLKTGDDNVLRNVITRLQNFFGFMQIIVIGTANVAKELRTNKGESIKA